MNDPIARREALRRLVVLSASTVVPAWLVACSKPSAPSCMDASGLTSEELALRNGAAAYTDKAADASKKCSSCALYKAAPEGKCGSCTAVKGPISPDGSCKLFAAKT